MRIIITNESVYEWAAYYTVKCILDYSDTDKPFVLSFPLRYVNKAYYQKLLSFYNDNIVSFKNIHIVSSGEYIDSNISQKYLEDNFLKFIDIPRENVHLFDSNVANRKEEAKRMANLIKELGNITLLIDTLAEDGSFLLNTPSSSLDGSVRDKKISEIIRSYESKKFNMPIEMFPKEGFTLGFEEAFNAKYVLVMANGYDVSDALSHCVEGSISQFYPTSVLQEHKKLISIGNERILKMASYISNEKNIPMWIRIVYIPGITDVGNSIEEYKEFIKTLKSVKKVEVLPYHEMGKYKWKELGLKYELEGVKIPTQEEVKKIEGYLNS